MPIHYALLYFLLLSALGFLLMGIDKHRAIHKRWRIPEKSLLLISFLGGAAGTTAGMLLFHHKTSHGRFRYGLPLLLLFQMGAIFSCLLRGISMDVYHF